MMKSTDCETNTWGQPVGESLDWTPPPYPSYEALTGNYVHIHPLLPRHSDALYQAFAHDHESLWTYLPYGPFAEASSYRQWVESVTIDSNQPGRDQFYCICTPAGTPCGVFALAAIAPHKGSIELAHVLFSTKLRATAMATEAVFLLLQKVFALGYRRCEWKCNALNAASRRAALRLGFSYEGLFRNALVIKGRNRDTAWFAMTDRDWQNARVAYTAWLKHENFDHQGRQKTKLSALTHPLLRDLCNDPLGTIHDRDDL